MGKRIKTKQIQNFYTDVKNAAQSITTYLSAGVLYPPPILSDNGDGSVDVTSCEASLRSDANHVTELAIYTIPAATNIVLNDNEINYICVNYNAGTPIYVLVAEANLPIINESDIIPVFTCSRIGLEIIVLKWDSLGSGLVNKLHARFVKTDRFARESGFGISEQGTRELVVTEGVVWNGGVRTELGELDSSVDTLQFWFKSGGVWGKTDVTQYNNSQYQGASDLVALTGGFYTVNWIFRCDCDGLFGIGLGDNEYETLGDAQNAQITDLPFSALNAFLIGRIIVKEGEDTGIIQSFFAQIFPSNLLSNHQNLSGLLDDGHSQYAMLNGRIGDILKIDTISPYTFGSGIVITSFLNINGKIKISNSIGSPELGDMVFDGTNFKGYNGTSYKKLDSGFITDIVLTTDATPTILSTISEIPSDSVTQIKLWVKAMEDDYSNWGTWVRSILLLKNNLGVLSIEDVNADVDATSVGMGSGDVVLSVVSNNLIVTVTGPAGNVTWTSNYEIL